MTALDMWLKQATRHLSHEAAIQVRREIGEHYDAARESAMEAGATGDEADRLAVAALGDAKTTNCRYRSVLLTAVEARMLRDGNCEARAVCSRQWLKWLLPAIPAAMLLSAAALFFTGASGGARVLAAAGIAAGLMFVAPFLPIYTPARARIFRCVKWVVMPASMMFAFGPELLKVPWLAASCLWPFVWIEWTRVSIRRKLRVEDWPKQLYL